MQIDLAQYKTIKKAIKQILTDNNMKLKDYIVMVRLSNESPFMTIHLEPKAPVISAVVDTDNDEEPANVSTNQEGQHKKVEGTDKTGSTGT